MYIFTVALFFYILGAIKMERSEHERAKYPDRINLDRKGLHSKLSLKSKVENSKKFFYKTFHHE